MLRLRCLRKNRSIVYRSPAKFSHSRIMGPRRRILRKIKVFNVEHGNSVGIIFYDFGGTYTRN